MLMEKVVNPYKVEKESDLLESLEIKTLVLNYK